MCLTCVELADARHFADELLWDCYGVRVGKALDPLDPRDFLVIERRLTKTVQAAVKGSEGRMLRAGLRGLDVDWATITPAQRRKVLAAAKTAAATAAAPAATAKKTQNLFIDKAGNITQAAKQGMAKQIGSRALLGVKLNQVDRRIIQTVAFNQAAFVRDEFGNRAGAMIDAQARAIVASGLKRGLGREALMRELRDGLGDWAQRRSDNYWRTVGNYMANTARSYGSLSTMAEAGVTKYRLEAVLDRSTTPMCRFMHGKVMTVQTAITNIEQATPSNPLPWMYEGKDAKGQPMLYYKKPSGQREKVATVNRSGYGKVNDTGSFSSSKAESQLQAAGIDTPPFHGNCRTTVQPEMGTRTFVTPSAPAKPAAPGLAPLKPGGSSAREANAFTTLNTARRATDGSWVHPKGFKSLKRLPDIEGEATKAGVVLDPAKAKRFTVKQSSIVFREVQTSAEGVAREIRTLGRMSNRNIGNVPLANRPVVVRYKGKLYALNADAQEKLLAQKFMRKAKADVRIIDLDMAGVGFTPTDIDPQKWAKDILPLMETVTAKKSGARAAGGKLRKKIREYMEKRYGITFGTRNERHILQVVGDNSSIMSKNHAAHCTWDGRVRMKQQYQNDALAGTKQLASGREYQPGGINRNWGFNTIIHEEVHVSSPMTWHGELRKGIEESTTEILSRKVVREMFGFTRATGNTPFALPSYSNGAMLRSGQQITGYGSYKGYINPMVKSVSKVTGLGPEETAKKVEQAVVRYRRMKTMDRYGHGQMSQTQAIDTLIGGMELEAKQADDLRKLWTGPTSPFMGDG